MEISWREEKRQRNPRKHGLDFADASKIFADPLATTVFDRVANQEERWHTIGALFTGGTFKIVVVVHTVPAGDDVDWVHIISMRPKTRENAGAMSKYSTADGSPLTPAQIARLDEIEAHVGDEDEFAPAPEVNWATAVRGRFHQPAEAASLRLGPDVAIWLRRRGPGYQAEINRILREKMLSEA